MPIGGGIVRQWRYEGAFSAIEAWAASNGCRSAVDEEALAEGVIHEMFLGCAAPTEMVLIEGCDHLWPGYPGVKEGSPAARLSGGELAWRFLATKRLASA